MPAIHHYSKPPCSFLEFLKILFVDDILTQHVSSIFGRRMEMPSPTGFAQLFALTHSFPPMGFMWFTPAFDLVFISPVAQDMKLRIIYILSIVCW